MAECPDELKHWLSHLFSAGRQHRLHRGGAAALGPEGCSLSFVPSVLQDCECAGRCCSYSRKICRLLPVVSSLGSPAASFFTVVSEEGLKYVDFYLDIFWLLA